MLTMLNNKPDELKSILSQTRQNIIRYNPELSNVRLTWTIYGWIVEASLDDLNVEIQSIKWSIEEEMENAGLEVIKILLEV